MIVDGPAIIWAYVKLCYLVAFSFGTVYIAYSFVMSIKSDIDS